MWELFIEPLISYGFMRLGLAAAVVVGVVCSVLSCLLVVRHQALLGDAISHAVLLGVVAGYLIAQETGVLLGALVVGILTGLAITYVERNSVIALDAVMGICFTAMFALGLALMSVAQPRGIDLFHVLFGNVLGVGADDLLLTIVSGGLVLFAVIVAFPAFHVWSFDPVMATATGVRTRALEYVFTSLLATAIVSALQTVGLLLVIALLITPGATAQLLTTRLRTMMAVAAMLGAAAAVSGLYTSFHLNVASGPAIVLAASFYFILALLVAPRSGVIVRGLRGWLARRSTSARELWDAGDNAYNDKTG